MQGVDDIKKLIANENFLKIAACVALVVVFLSAYTLGQSAQGKVHRNMKTRLDSTRSRFQICQSEVRMLSGEAQSRMETEMQLANQEHAALLTENELLTEDNQILREENYELEEQIDELRDELDDKDWVSDDEVEKLEGVMSMGNNTEELKDVLEDAAALGGINKDVLIEKLMAELRIKRKASANCRAALHKLKGRLQSDVKPSSHHSSRSSGSSRRSSKSSRPSKSSVLG
eukprot:TRINITY_DN68106_c11_g4_i1.p1 TRINITY_DN68106_c11_g4~~TRINITY_DN68106_c11_g4_i1.p1  ORF type:complete len:231 (-),score=20.20 TRINITY_DN68106_c11_g4_i1:40-732(-)